MVQLMKGKNCTASLGDVCNCNDDTEKLTIPSPYAAKMIAAGIGIPVATVGGIALGTAIGGWAATLGPHAMEQLLSIVGIASPFAAAGVIAGTASTGWPFKLKDEIMSSFKDKNVFPSCDGKFKKLKEINAQILAISDVTALTKENYPSLERVDLIENNLEKFPDFNKMSPSIVSFLADLNYIPSFECNGQLYDVKGHAEKKTIDALRTCEQNKSLRYMKKRSMIGRVTGKYEYADQVPMEILLGTADVGQCPEGGKISDCINNDPIKSLRAMGYDEDELTVPGEYVPSRTCKWTGNGNAVDKCIELPSCDQLSGGSTADCKVTSRDQEKICDYTRSVGRVIKKDAVVSSCLMPSMPST